MDEEKGVAPNASSQSQSQELAAWLVGRVNGLQMAYLANSPGAVARLAGLRSPRVSIASAEAWELLGTLPATSRGFGDEPSRGEQAAFDALRLYAIHQQGRGRGMHRAGTRLGSALRTLRSVAGEDGVDRRFKQLGAASSYDAARRHLSGLIAQLRAAEVGLDYGLLARDLRDLQDPARRSGVRIRWGRDYYRPASNSNQLDSDDTQGAIK